MTTTGTYDQFSTSGPSGLSTPERVLTIGAHPDDAEFGAGATIARWASEGTHVTMLIVTDGSKGSWDPTTEPKDLAEMRRAEQEAAASALGVSSVIHLDHVDGELEHTMALRTQVALEIRRARPDIVLSHDPWQRYQMHPDHRATGLAAVDGVVSAREPMALGDSGIRAHRPEALLLWSADEPDHAEPVDQQWFDVKLGALLCHSSQVHTTMGDADQDPEARARFTKMLHDWHAAGGRKLGTGPAEVFKRLTP
jgi:LmbE family N-acetylglucosaminyl deacetylase